jgi:hypothetical protein
MFDGICHFCEKCKQHVAEKIVAPCCDWLAENAGKMLLACGCVAFAPVEAYALLKKGPPPMMQTHAEDTVPTDPANTPSFTTSNTPTTTTAGPQVEMPPYPVNSPTPGPWNGFQPWTKRQG